MNVEEITRELQSGYCTLPSGDHIFDEPLIMYSGQHLHLQEGAVILRNFSRGTGWEGALIQTVPSIVNRSISITGKGRIHAAPEFSGNVLSLNSHDLLLEGFSISSWNKGRAILACGDNMIMRRLRITGSPLLPGNGGIRIGEGHNFLGEHLHVESGDDALQFVPLVRGPFADGSIRGGIYQHCYAKSGARAIAVHIEESLSCSIDSCIFKNIIGEASQRTVYVRNDSPTGKIHNISLSALSLMDTTTKFNHSIHFHRTSDCSIQASITGTSPNLFCTKNTGTFQTCIHSY